MSLIVQDKQKISSYFRYSVTSVIQFGQLHIFNQLKVFMSVCFLVRSVSWESFKDIPISVKLSRENAIINGFLSL